MNRLSTENLVEPITKDLEIQLQAPFLLYKNAKCNQKQNQKLEMIHSNYSDWFNVVIGLNYRCNYWRMVLRRI